MSIKYFTLTGLDIQRPITGEDAAKLADQTQDAELGPPDEIEMAKVLAASLSSDSMVPPWDEMSAMDKSAMLKACEWLRAHMDETAR